MSTGQPSLKKDVTYLLKSPDHEICHDIHIFLLTQKRLSEFCNLLNHNDYDQTTYRKAFETGPNLMGMEDGISIHEERQWLKRMKKGKAVGYDELPDDVLHSEQCILFLHNLFNKCYNTGKISSI